MSEANQFNEINKAISGISKSKPAKHEKYAATLRNLPREIGCNDALFNALGFRAIERISTKNEAIGSIKTDGFIFCGNACFGSENHNATREFSQLSSALCGSPFTFMRSSGTPKLRAVSSASFAKSAAESAGKSGAAANSFSCSAS